MIQTTLHCGKCGSSALRKNGHSKGNAKYLCTACRYQAVFAPAAPRKAAQYAQVEKLLLERNSHRSIVRATGVSRMRVAKLAKKSAVCTTVAPQTEPAPDTGIG